MNRRLLRLLLPQGSFFADDQLTTSAKRLVTSAGLAGLAAAVGGAAIWLLDTTSWREVLAGALLAWSASGMIWATSSYRSARNETGRDLRALAERDLLHARLNHFADRLGAPLLNLNDGQIQSAVDARVERHAHLNGLEEFGIAPNDDGYQWWDNTGCGYED